VLVHIVADYGHGDLAFSEVVLPMRIHLPDAEPGVARESLRLWGWRRASTTRLLS
jgi:hypothetical protein